MATDCIDASLPFSVKIENDTCNDGTSEISMDDINNFLPLPLLSIDTSVIHDELLSSNREFLCLTEMVRTVYLSHLQKCLLSNYRTCYKQSDGGVLSTTVKKCADYLEQKAVRFAIESNLYRQNMLKMIADIKSHTVKRKMYKKLLIYLEAPKDKIDVAVQTDEEFMDSHGTDNIQSVCITSNSEEMMQTSPIINSNDFDGNENIIQDLTDEIHEQMSHDEDIMKEVFNDSSPKIENKSDSQVNNANIIGNPEENSQDSILQHMEDMFCESDDSSDLTKLIEKYSGISKASIDKDISDMYLSSDVTMDPSHCGVSQDNKALSITNIASSAEKRSTSEGKLSYSRYKEMRSKKADVSEEFLHEKEMTDMKDLKQKERINAVWLVERVHQVSKLNSRMTELSMKNYRKHGMLKEKFLQLFGDSDEDEMMPESPICIEEHLSACKERIAPWIVKYLMPFYKKRRIKNRQLFKTVAKYIADMLILKNTFPEQECVSKFISDYFKNKKCIKIKQDIYL